MTKLDFIVIGGGVVGSAIAAEFVRVGRRGVLLEKEPFPARHLTSRNSGVIHSGIYYPPGSRKALLCVRGNGLLYAWCKAHGVPHRRTGKLIVAQVGQEGLLDDLYRNARENGAPGIRPPAAVPEALAGMVRGASAMLSPDTGIVDAHALTESLLTDGRSHGLETVFSCEVKAANRTSDGFLLETTRGEIEGVELINAAGARSDEIARLLGDESPVIHPCRGDYFRVRGNPGLRTLVYPVKDPRSPGLGIHLTLELDGAIKLGPDAFYVSEPENYNPPFDEDEKRRRFFETARTYLPFLRLEDLAYDSCGIRPKLRGPKDPGEVDFRIERGHSGAWHLFGIESPGLTAALAIAEALAAGGP